MKNKNLKILIIILVLIACYGVGVNQTHTIKVDSKPVYYTKEINSTSSTDVTDRDLALLASLTYEPVPNDKNYTVDKTGVNNGCTIKSDKITKACSFSANPNPGAKINGYPVLKYVEGMSTRKRNLFTLITTTKVEPGPAYYMLDYAKVEEASDWKIVNYKSERSIAGLTDSTLSTKLGWSGTFDAITFKRGNDYVISYRGTDFPDILEWLIDISYAVGKNEQSNYAENYAVSEYEKITSGQYGKANGQVNIYITGHSLGAYLAQVGGAAISKIEQEKITQDSNYYSPFAGVVYFNGMGVDAMSVKNNVHTQFFKGDNSYTKQVSDALVWLATHDRKGNKVEKTTENAKLNWTNQKGSSGRLVLYRSDNDPVSAIGWHYGEIYQINDSYDSVLNHKNNHSLFFGVDGIIKEKIAEIKESEPTATTVEAEQVYTESLSNSLYAVVSGVDTLSTSTTSLDDIPDSAEEIKFENNPNNIEFKPISPIVALINSVSNGVKDNNLNNIIEAANIAHETDGFLCILDNTSSNTPTSPLLTMGITDANPDSEEIYYINGKNDVEITAILQNACATKYEWEVEGNPINNNSDKFVIEKNNSVQEGTVKEYTVKVTYGYNLSRLTLNNEYKYDDSINDTNVEDTITKTITVKYDKTPPQNCVFKTRSLSIKKGTSQTVDFSCNEGTSANNLSGVNYYTTLLGVKNSYYFGVSGINGHATVYANKRLFTSSQYLHAKGTVTDLAGNSTSVNDKIPVKSTR